MYKISKRMEIAGSHQLELPYSSPCSNLHGHNWIIIVHVKAKELTDYGMVIDFTDLKQLVHNQLDHQHINDIIPKGMNPTAENMSKWILEEVNVRLRVRNYPEGTKCYKVEVQESEGNIATYEI